MKIPAGFITIKKYEEEHGYNPEHEAARGLTTIPCTLYTDNCGSCIFKINIDNTDHYLEVYVDTD